MSGATDDSPAGETSDGVPAMLPDARNPSLVAELSETDQNPRPDRS